MSPEIAQYAQGVSGRQWILFLGGATAALAWPLDSSPVPVALPNPQDSRAATVAVVELIGKGHGLPGLGCIKDRDVSPLRLCEPIGLHASRMERPATPCAPAP